LIQEIGADTGSLDLRNLATLIEAVLHGLSIQRAADPAAFDPKVMMGLVVDVILTYMKSKFGLNKRIKKIIFEGVKT
jgi:hypothetical protein